jgi:hypothetical protein
MQGRSVMCMDHVNAVKAGILAMHVKPNVLSNSLSS